MPAAPSLLQPDDLELPELDPTEDNREVDVGTFRLDLDDLGGSDAAELTAIIDTFEVDIQLSTDSGNTEAAGDLDVGVSELLSTLPDVHPDPEGEAPTTLDSQLDLHLEEPLEGDEPSTDAELGSDGLEPLPELLRDDGDGDGPDREGSLLPSAPEGAIADGPSYESEWLLLGAPCSALWADAGGVVAAAERLMRFGTERSSHTLPRHTRVNSLTLLERGSVLMATSRGLLELAPSGDLAYADVPDLARIKDAEISQLIAPDGHTLWARLTNGVLLRRRDKSWERHETGGEVKALTCQGQLVTLLVMSRQPTLQVSADGGACFRELLLPEPAATVARGAGPLLAARASVIVLADAERGLCVSSDGGETFRMVTGAVNVTAVAVDEGPHPPKVFAALYREGRDLSELVSADPQSGEACRIAELSGQTGDDDTEETGRTAALAICDGYLWCAGGYGLARLRA